MRNTSFALAMEMCIEIIIITKVIIEMMNQDEKHKLL